MSTEIPFKDRYAAILKAYDYSPTELATKLNKPVAPFYKYRTGEIAMPRKDVLEKMLLLFHGLRREYLFQGQGPMKQPTFIAPTESANKEPINNNDDSQDWKAIALKALKDRDEMARDLARVTEDRTRLLVRLLEAERPDLFTDQEHSKIESSGHTTAPNQFCQELTEVYGLIRYKSRDEDKDAWAVEVLEEMMK